MVDLLFWCHHVLSQGGMDLSHFKRYWSDDYFQPYIVGQPQPQNCDHTYTGCHYNVRKWVATQSEECCCKQEEKGKIC